MATVGPDVRRQLGETPGVLEGLGVLLGAADGTARMYAASTLANLAHDASRQHQVRCQGLSPRSSRVARF